MIMTKSGPYHQTREEMEVVITFNAAGSTMRIHSTYPVINRKLDKLCQEYPEVYQRIQDPDGVEDDFRKYEVDRKMLGFRKPPSEARKKAAAEAARHLPRKQASERLKNT